ncbi:heme exporter protein CcmD, partial [Klebsiella pneumoniae]|nr:heme exporter protein CcmD [Klebsiella pneumoniae]
VRALIASRKWKRELERLEKDQSATSDAAVSPRPQAAQSAIGPLK